MEIFQKISLTREQVYTLHELSAKRAGIAHIYQYPNQVVRVEFEFPYAFIIARNGRAIQTQEY